MQTSVFHRDAGNLSTESTDPGPRLSREKLGFMRANVALCPRRSLPRVLPVLCNFYRSDVNRGYFGDEVPRRFGRRSVYAMGKVARTRPIGRTSSRGIDNARAEPSNKRRRAKTSTLDNFGATLRREAPLPTDLTFDGAAESREWKTTENSIVGAGP